jgi:hypothetical protein
VHSISGKVVVWADQRESFKLDLELQLKHDPTRFSGAYRSTCPVITKRIDAAKSKFQLKKAGGNLNITRIESMRVGCETLDNRSFHMQSVKASTVGGIYFGDDTHADFKACCVDTGFIKSVDDAVHTKTELMQEWDDITGVNNQRIDRTPNASSFWSLATTTRFATVCVSTPRLFPRSRAPCRVD